MNSNPGPAGSEPLVEIAYARLEAAIVEGRLPRGAPLVESQLVAMTGLGRTPVRHAIQRLADVGLAVVAPYRGASVSDPGPDFEARLLLMRAELDPVVARLAAAAPDRTAIAPFAAPGTGSPSQRLALSRQGYEVLLHLARNPFLTRALLPVAASGHRLMHEQLGRAPDAAPELAPQGLFQAVTEGDVAGAETLAAGFVGALRDSRRARRLAQIAALE